MCFSIFGKCLIIRQSFYVRAKFSQLRRNQLFATDSHTNISYYFSVKCFVLCWRQDIATTSEPNICQEFYVRSRSLILNHRQVFATTLEPDVCYFDGLRFFYPSICNSFGTNSLLLRWAKLSVSFDVRDKCLLLRRMQVFAATSRSSICNYVGGNCFLLPLT